MEHMIQVLTNNEQREEKNYPYRFMKNYVLPNMSCSEIIVSVEEKKINYN